MLCSPDDLTPVTLAGPKVRIGVLASGRGSNFRSILEAVSTGSLHVEVAALVCNVEDAGALDIAREHDVPVHLMPHKQWPSRQAFDAAIVETLKTSQVEWIIMAGWMRIVTPVLLDAFPDRVINLHPSLLPSFRGLHAVEQALEAGVRITGCTVHLVRPEVDDGPILAQVAVPVEPGDTPETLHARIQRAEHHIFPRAIARAIAQA